MPKKLLFSPREPGRAIQVPTPPILGVRNSIISPILINQELRHPKMRFSGSTPTEFPFIHHPPPNRAENGFFHLMSPAGHFRYPPPLFWDAAFNYEPHSHQPSAGTAQNAVFRVNTDRTSVYPTPPNGAVNGFFHLVSPAGHFRYPPTLFCGCLIQLSAYFSIIERWDIPKRVFQGADPQNFGLSIPPLRTLPKMAFLTS